MNRRYHFYFFMLISFLVVGCSTHQVKDIDRQSLISASTDIAEDQLLDVGIVIFDPGLAEVQDEDDQDIQDVRKAEARFIPVHLKYTLQHSGHWGAVRVIPSEMETMNLIVNGKILESDGEVLSLKILAKDATGKIWLDTIYNSELPGASAYAGMGRGKKDAFQSVYNAISNDLLRVRNQQSDKQIQNIQRVALLRFSEDIMPDAFSSYLEKDEDLLLKAVRIPADSDRMFERVQKIKGRDSMLVDTLDGYYDQFYAEMWESYSAWRSSHREEVVVYRELKADALKRYLLGAAAIAGAVGLAFAGVDGTGLIQAAMLAGGGYAIKSGIDKSDEAQINADAIAELDESFNAELKPQLIEINGQTVKLTGTARSQYQTWRQMLRKLYVAETGFVPEQENSMLPLNQMQYQ